MITLVLYNYYFRVITVHQHVFYFYNTHINQKLAKFTMDCVLYFGSIVYFIPYSHRGSAIIGPVYAISSYMSGLKECFGHDNHAV